MQTTFRRASFWVVPAVLAALAALSLLPAAPPRALWLDEAFGLHTGVINSSWFDLLWHGAPGQGSPHPLYYVWEKLLLAPWMPAPQHYWNLNFYFRLAPIFFYALSGAVMFVSASRALPHLFPRISSWQRSLIASAAAVFFYKIQFAQFYALEARPYSLWLFLSSAHLALTLPLLVAGFRGRGERLGYALVSTLLCFVASPGILQVGLSFLAITFPRRFLREVPFVIPAAVVAVFYVREVGHNGYSIGGYGYYLECLREVAYKSFHARNGWVFFSVLILALVRLATGSSLELRARLSFYLASLVGLSFLLYLMCRWDGFFLASRQYIYLLPAFEVLYGLALLQAAAWLALLPPLRGKVGVAGWITLWAALLLAQNIPELFHRAITLPAALAPYQLYGVKSGELCTKDIRAFGSSEQEIAKLDRSCH